MIGAPSSARVRSLFKGNNWIAHDLSTVYTQLPVGRYIVDCIILFQKLAHTTLVSWLNVARKSISTEIYYQVLTITINTRRVVRKTSGGVCFRGFSCCYVWFRKPIQVQLTAVPAVASHNGTVWKNTCTIHMISNRRFAFGLPMFGMVMLQ